MLLGGVPSAVLLACELDSECLQCRFVTILYDFNCLFSLARHEIPTHLLNAKIAEQRRILKVF